MSRRSFAIALSMVLILVVALMSAGPVAAKSERAKERAEHARILKYWTPKRMANAVPRGFVKTKRGFVPAAKGGNKPDKPKGPGGDGGSTNSVTGAPWNKKDKGLNATGKVFFTLGSSNYVCSGAVVDDLLPNGKRRDGYSMVLTAGHCAVNESNGTFAKNFMFVPAYDGSSVNCFSTPGTCFTASALVVHTGFASAGGFNERAIKHDWAFAIFDDLANDRDLDANGQFFDIAFTAPSTGNIRKSFGYPAAGKYSGGDLIYCEGPVAPDSNYGTWGLACDMTGGASGGPWIRDYAGSNEALNSVNSYKYNGGPLKNYMFGPEFNGKTDKTFQAALATTTVNTEVSGSVN
jgi:hypothetical protein